MYPRRKYRTIEVIWIKVNFYIHVCVDWTAQTQTRLSNSHMYCEYVSHRFTGRYRRWSGNKRWPFTFEYLYINLISLCTASINTQTSIYESNSILSRCFWELNQMHVMLSTLMGISTWCGRCLRCWMGLTSFARGRYHGGRRPSSDNSFHSPTVIPPSALDKPSIMNCTIVGERRSEVWLHFRGNALWYWVCRMPMVEWRLDCEDCRHLTVVGLHDTGPWYRKVPAILRQFVCALCGHGPLSKLRADVKNTTVVRV